MKIQSQKICTRIFFYILPSPFKTCDTFGRLEQENFKYVEDNTLGNKI